MCVGPGMFDHVIRDMVIVFVTIGVCFGLALGGVVWLIARWLGYA